MKSALLFLFLIFITFSSKAFSESISTLGKYSEAVQLIDSGKCDEAVSLLSDVLRESQNLIYAHVLIGICAFNSGDYERASNEIKIFIADENNAMDGSDKYPLALIYYLRAQNKLRNSQEFSRYYELIKKYPIPDVIGTVFSAQALVDAAGDTTYPEIVRSNSGQMAISILSKDLNQSSGVHWFYNTYGCALIINNHWIRNRNDRISFLKKAKEQFGNEIEVNPRAQVYVNLSIADRLLAEEIKGGFWDDLTKYKSQKILKLKYPELKKSLQEGLDYLTEADKAIDVARSSAGYEGVEKKIEAANFLNKKVRSEYFLDANIQRILKSSN